MSNPTASIYDGRFGSLADISDKVCQGRGSPEGDARVR